MVQLLDARTGTEKLYEIVVNDPALYLTVLVAVSAECKKRLGPPWHGKLTPKEFAAVVVSATGLLARRNSSPFTAVAKIGVKMGVLEQIDQLIEKDKGAVKKRYLYFTISRLGTMIATLSAEAGKRESAIKHIRTLLTKHLPA